MIIDNNSIVYVACPPNVFTGGPELLHQLVHELRNLKIEAYMYYFPYQENPIHEEFKKYNIEFTSKVEDNNKNIIVVPELNNFINLLSNYKKIGKVVWWLSVDNFYKSILSKKKVSRILNKLSVYSDLFIKHSFEEKARKLSRKMDISEIPELKNVDYYFVQSFYARNHLLKKGISESRIFFLSDYINQSFLTYSTGENVTNKSDLIIYNPKKGVSFTKKIISYANKRLNFVPLQNMTRDEVINTMLKSKVYMDFGNHPGKDRMPREAAICSNCIITGEKGSAAFYEDVPIPKQYKFPDETSYIPEIVSQIEACINDYKTKITDFKYYRNYIKKEKEMFINDIKEIFVR